MLHATQRGLYQSSLLGDMGDIYHGYTTRRMGDMRRQKKRDAFLTACGWLSDQYVSAQQVHSGSVHVVDSAGHGVVPDVDGLIIRDAGKLVGVRTADCVPLLLVDPDAHVAGAVHAGWRGLLEDIIPHAVMQMKELGASENHIRAVIGPHIGMCCYTVPQERAAAFMSRYHDPMVAALHNDTWSLDIGRASYADLSALGVRESYIDVTVCCTSCQADKWYSYRADTKETFGEILGVIGFIH